MKEFVGLLKLPPKLLAGVAIATGSLLFLPDSIISHLYMEGLKDKFGLLIGATFIISVSILGSNALVITGKKINEMYKEKRWLKKRKEMLKSLDSVDKKVLKQIMKHPDKTARLSMNSGIARKLWHYKIISPAGSTHLVSPFDMKITFFLQPWVVEEIRENPKLLK